MQNVCVTECIKFSVEKMSVSLFIVGAIVEIFASLS